MQIMDSEIVEALEGDGVKEFQKLLYFYRNPTYAPDLIVFISFLLPLLLLTQLNFRIPGHPRPF